MAPTHAWALAAALLCTGAVHAEETPTPFHPLNGLSPTGVEAHPELAALVADARRLAESDAELNAKQARKLHYGGSASYDEAERDREALAQALDLVAGLELQAAARDDFERANALRGAQTTLVFWINSGIEGRHDAQTRPPRLETSKDTGETYPELIRDMPRTATVTYGMVPAAVALVHVLASDLRAHGPAEPTLGDEAQLSEIRALRAELTAARHDVIAQAMARAAAEADLEAAIRAADGEATPEQLRQAQTQAGFRAESLAQTTQTRLEQATPVMRMLLGEAMQHARREATEILERSQPAGILARRARGPYLFLVFVDGLSPDVIQEAASRRDAQGRPVLP
jgi:hypothetical protein